MIVNELESYLAAVQIVMMALISFPAIYWIFLRLTRNKERSLKLKNCHEDSDIRVILPMKNEEKNVRRKLESIVSEIFGNDSVDLVVATSNSKDETEKIAREFLESSDLPRSRWSIVNFVKPGKNVALNGVIRKTDEGIIVMSDADARVSPGWLEIVIERLSEDDIGVVSGIEEYLDSGLDHFHRYYREKSNWLRIKESENGSTPVLEGSIIAWDIGKIGKIEIDERVNADDAQIGIKSVRMGFRSIVDSRIKFSDFEGEGRVISNSIRRSQGLSIILAKNADLIFISNVRNSRMALFNALFLYTTFPWIFLFFGINSVIAFALNPEISFQWPFLAISFLAIVGITPQGRFLIKGVLISIIAQVQLLAGKRYNVWNPAR